jgi:hypothetical protein
MVDWGMRYGNPSLKAAAERLVARGMRAHPLRPALSAVFGRHERNGMRQALQCTCILAKSASIAGRRALLP